MPIGHLYVFFGEMSFFFFLMYHIDAGLDSSGRANEVATGVQEYFWKEEHLKKKPPKQNKKKKKKAKPSTLALRPFTQLFIKGLRQVFTTGSHLSSNLNTQALSSPGKVVVTVSLVPTVSHMVCLTCREGCAQEDERACGE